MNNSRHTLSYIQWVRKNLFSSWYNIVLTILSTALIYIILKAVLIWIFFEADWGVVPVNLNLFMMGAYPAGEEWRIWSVIYMIALLTGMSAGIWGGMIFRVALNSVCFFLGLVILPFNTDTRLWLFGAAICLAAGYSLARAGGRSEKFVAAGWILSFPVTVMLLGGFGGNELLPRVLTTNWGGLLLTLLLAAVGIVASFPLGILLALARRSGLPAIKWFSTLYVETIRGVPLVSILFMSQIMLPIVLPDFRIDKVLRAMVGLTFYSSAYMAENIRGGLQGVPAGQYEAAKAVGLSYPQAMLLIIMPQALRSVIPAIVGQFISLFKDTSLVAIIGLLDLLGIARSIIANPDWLGLQTEVYMFVAAVYFIFAWSMSNASRKLEVALGVGKG